MKCLKQKGQSSNSGLSEIFHRKRSISLPSTPSIFSIVKTAVKGSQTWTSHLENPEYPRSQHRNKTSICLLSSTKQWGQKITKQLQMVNAYVSIVPQLDLGDAKMNTSQAPSSTNLCAREVHVWGIKGKLQWITWSILDGWGCGRRGEVMARRLGKAFQNNLSQMLIHNTWDSYYSADSDWECLGRSLSFSIYKMHPGGAVATGPWSTPWVARTSRKGWQRLSLS